MKAARYYTLFLFFLSCSITCIAQSSKQPSALLQLKIKFKNVIDSQVMHLQGTYKNLFGEEYILRTFKYYISNLSLLTESGKAILFKGSHLVNEADSSSKIILLHIRKGKYKEISFMIGVDSIYNISGTQTGDLDPLKGMFWTWNSGYITAKFEATSNASTLQNNKVEYHIGGFKVNQKTSRKVVLPFVDALMVDGETKVVIEANANRWFDGVHQIKIGTNPACTTPGILATQLADNYSKMFSISYQ